jgi:SET domain-containing protein
MLNKFVKSQTIKSWVDPRVVVKSSLIEGFGMFAHETINVGETVIIWGGTIFTQDQIKAGMAKARTASKIDENFYLADSNDETDSPDYYLNHSCDPNVWLKDEITLVARRKIEIGEELTADYALWEADSGWELSPCRCGKVLCRGKVTGNDWQLMELQQNYQGHFTPYLNKKIVDWRWQGK